MKAPKLEEKSLTTEHTEITEIKDFLCAHCALCLHRRSLREDAVQQARVW
jgi:hypothetical protein